MFKLMSGLLGLSALISPLGAYLGESYDSGVTNVYYKYETNEVNSIDDLIEGNIYHLEFTFDIFDLFLNDYYDDYYDNNYYGISFGAIEYYNLNIYTQWKLALDETYISDNEGNVIFNFFNDYSLNFMYRLNVGYNDDIDESIQYQFNTYLIEDVISLDYFNYSIDFVLSYWGIFDSKEDNDLQDDLNAYLSELITDYNLISRCENIPIAYIENVIEGSESVGLFNIFNDYINDNLFNNSVLSDMTFDMFGVTLSVASWLSITITIILMICFLIILFILFRWLFKLVSGWMLLK